MSKKIKIIAIVVVVIVIIALCATLVWYSILRGKRAELTGIVIGANLESEGLNLIIEPIPPEHSGEAKFKISYEEKVTYPESALQLKTNLLIPYNEFVVGNGNYIIDASFGNKTASKSFEITGVVEDIDVFVTKVSHEAGQPKFEVQVWPLPAPFADTSVIEYTKVKVTITKLDDNTLLVENRTVPFDPARGVYKDIIDYTRSGYYKIYAELTNYVKPTSPHLRCSKYMLNETNGYANLINLAPVITKAPQDATIYNTTAENGTYFRPLDAYESDGWARFVCEELVEEETKNYEITYSAIDYDSDTFLVTWDFGWNKTAGNATSGINDTSNSLDVWYQYPSEVTDCTAILYVYDKYHAIESAQCEITVVKTLSY